METKTKTVEKMELARDLGLTGIYGGLHQKVETKKAIDLLTGMKFKPITRDEINKKLPSFYWAPKESRTWLFNLIGIGLVVGMLLSALVTLVVSALFCGKDNPPAMFLVNHGWTVALSSYAAWNVAIFLLNGWHEATIRRMPLREWESEVPYGALLAVKEAREKGIEQFVISYPVTERSERLRMDPVITGIFHGIEVEVFSWDDGQIYE